MDWSAGTPASFSRTWLSAARGRSWGRRRDCWPGMRPERSAGDFTLPAPGLEAELRPVHQRAGLHREFLGGSHGIVTDKARGSGAPGRRRCHGTGSMLRRAGVPRRAGLRPLRRWEACQQFPLAPREAVPECDFGVISTTRASNRGDFESIFRPGGNCWQACRSTRPATPPRDMPSPESGRARLQPVDLTDFPRFRATSYEA